MDPDFKLGPALVKEDNSTAHLPDPWRTELLGHLNSTSRSAVAHTSKAALQLLLGEWPQATLTVHVRSADAEPAEVLRQRLQSARKQLAQRGGKATTLLLKPRGKVKQADTWWEPVFSTLGQGRRLRSCPCHITQLHAVAPVQLRNVAADDLHSRKTRRTLREHALT